MPRFDLQRFLGETGLTIARLASRLQVAQTYLEKVVRGEAKLTSRDQEACRTLWKRLTQAKQMELPFAESAETFTRGHARALARARALATSARQEASSPLPRPRRGAMRARATASQQV